MPARARQKRAIPVLICKKCLKRYSDGRAMKHALKSKLREQIPAGSRNKPRLILTSCVGICPKRAVVVSNGRHLARGEFLLVDTRSVGRAAVELMASPQEGAAT